MTALSFVWVYPYSQFQYCEIYMYWGPQANLLCMVLTLMFRGDEKLVCGVGHSPDCFVNDFCKCFTQVVNSVPAEFTTSVPL